MYYNNQCAWSLVDWTEFHDTISAPSYLEIYLAQSMCFLNLLRNQYGLKKSYFEGLFLD